MELLYKHAIPTPKEQCSKPLQLGVSFAGGYIAGIFCAVVSHPADNLVSFLNNSQGATISDVSELFLFLLVHILFVLIVALACISSNHILMNYQWHCTGREEARVVGFVYSWPSSSYTHDRKPYRSAVEHL